VSDACREAEDALVIDPGDPRADGRVAAHVARCAACRARAAEHARLVEVLRGQDATVDEVTRARWLAQLAPSLDELATRYGAGAREARPRWRPAMYAAAAAAVIAVAAAAAVLRRSPASAPDAPAPAPAHAATAPRVAPPAIADRAVLRPYVVAGSLADADATALLADRVDALAVPAGQLVRAELGADARLALVGPSSLAVRGQAADLVQLDLESGTLLVDAPAGGRPFAVVSGTALVRAQAARFAVAAADGRAPAVFVDRGEIEVSGVRVTAGQWYGPDDRRSAALVGLLRDHGNAIAPAPDPSGVLMVPGSGMVITEAGAVLGPAPLWARVPLGTLTLVVTDGGDEARLPVEVGAGAVARVARAVPAPPAPLAGARPPRARAPGAAPLAPIVDDESPAAMYAAAEAALGRGERDEARAIWSRLVDRYPRSSHAASAMYDLAGLARAAGELAEAQAWLGRLLDRSPPAALREPARYLRCRLDVAAEPDASAACFRDFRRDFPDSAHDAEVLGWLMARAEEAGGCAAAGKLASEYLARHAGGGLAGRARGIAACADAAAKEPTP
jgi:hypothetical protein